MIKLFKGKSLIHQAIVIGWTIALAPIVLLALRLAVYHYGYGSEPAVYTSTTWAVISLFYTFMVMANIAYIILRCPPDMLSELKKKPPVEDNLFEDEHSPAGKA